MTQLGVVDEAGLSRTGHVRRNNEDSYLIRGDLTLKDQTRQVEIPAEFHGVISDPWGLRTGFTSRFTVDRRDKAFPAPGLINISCSHNDEFLLLRDPLSFVCRVSANHTDCQSFGDVFRHSKKVWDGAERPPSIVLVETGGDYPLPHVGEPIADFNQLGREELGFINANHLSFISQLHYFMRLINDI